MNYECKENLFVKFFSDLELLSQKYEELMDTDVRDAIHLTLNHFFIWGGENSLFPVTYGMFSLEADQAVAQIIRRFITDANDFAKTNELPYGQARLDLLQNPAITTPGGHRYDEFIGHVDRPLPQESLPEYLFEEGEYDLFE
jgi:hypothetical protein